MRWQITIPRKYKKKICGLCGNWDDDKNNDFTLKNGEVVSMRIYAVVKNKHDTF